MIQPTVSLDGRILGPTREERPNERIEIVDWGKATPDHLQVHIEVATETPDEFASLLEWDETVCEFEQFGPVAGRHRYILEYSPDLPDIRAHSAVVDNDGIPHRCYTLADGEWMVELSFVDRDSFGTFCDRCDEIGLPPELHRLQTVPDSERHEYGLTERQRAALENALDAGYFEYPQAATQEDIASRLNISRQSAAALLHRGLQQILSETVGTPPDQHAE
ncbi:helix-turn-helix domain-containing protein [Halovenus aranensis]|uniref:helix-turn-helix domain-containing protein n=1 Tax=Halovenus aranensis TaxID=890420 RepID=UPI000B88821A|nr:helix-turn-helix domain-containing protein [Halovenus aranensis]